MLQLKLSYRAEKKLLNEQTLIRSQRFQVMEGNG